jgi:hypothetical protein
VEDDGVAGLKRITANVMASSLERFRLVADLILLVTAASLCSTLSTTLLMFSLADNGNQKGSLTGTSAALVEFGVDADSVTFVSALAVECVPFTFVSTREAVSGDAA